MARRPAQLKWMPMPTGRRRPYRLGHSSRYVLVPALWYDICTNARHSGQGGRGLREGVVMMETEAGGADVENRALDVAPPADAAARARAAGLVRQHAEQLTQPD